jgi:hypothetical protein
LFFSLTCKTDDVTVSWALLKCFPSVSLLLKAAWCECDIAFFVGGKQGQSNQCLL